MENSSFVPNHLSIVLASSVESREAPRMPAPPHSFSNQSLDKDLPTAPPPFSSAGFVYHPGEPFPSPIYAPMPPFPRPSLESNIGIMGPSGGAFRHLGPHEGAEPYHSAFTPAKKKSEDITNCSTFSTDGQEQGYNKTVDDSEVKDERPPSRSSAGGDTNSDVHSDNGDRSTPDSEGRTLRKSRKRAVDGHVPCCPVCGLSLRPGETDGHLSVELEKLDRILRGGRKSRDSTPSNRKMLACPPGRKGKDSPSPEAASKARYEGYQRIRSNRQTRLNARSRNKKRRAGEDMTCPVCSERMICTAEELTVHVELCLKKQRQGEEEEEAVDVEGDGEGEGDQFEEYTWAGQTRVRATSLLEGGFAGSGFQTSSSKRMSEDEGDLNVDGDDTEEYGRPQFSEMDLVPLGSDEPGEERQRQALRGALLSANEVVNESTSPRETTPGVSKKNIPLDCQSEGAASGGQGVLMSALKARLKELEGSRDDKQKCLICMNQYQEPAVSIQCWHVHCQQCWFHTLGAKKLCPQCNMITSPSDLRRIYL